jgi:hypothetical protein
MSIAKKSMVTLAAALITGGFLVPSVARADQASTQTATTTKSKTPSPPAPVEYLVLTLVGLLVT